MHAAMVLSVRQYCLTDMVGWRSRQQCAPAPRPLRRWAAALQQT